MNAKELIDLLNKERDYHANHPLNAALKFLYALGASLAAVVSSLYFGGKINDALTGNLSGTFGIFTFTLFGLGILFILLGLDEHNRLHLQQRKKIETAINYILKEYNTFDYDLFWKIHGIHTLELWRKKLKDTTPLITLEPDVRGYWKFHDRKIESGVFLLLIAYACLIVLAYHPIK